MRNTIKKLHVLLFILTKLIGPDLALSASAEEMIGTVRISANSNASVRSSASFDGKNIGEAKAGKECDLPGNVGQWYKSGWTQIPWVGSAVQRLRFCSTASVHRTFLSMLQRQRKRSFIQYLSLGALLHKNRSCSLSG